MSDTTITAEERARLRSVLSEHGTPQVEDRIILRLLNTIEQAEARALTWTHEPPKVAGWYWCRVSKLYQPRLVEVYDSEDGLRFGSGDSWQEPSMSVESCGFEWAGPIPAPIEP